MKLQLCQFNWAYDGDIYLPLSAGMLAAVVREDAALRERYDVDLNLRFERGEPAEIAAGLDADVVGFSIYVWNEQLSLAVAREVRTKRPGALIVFGGPSVPGNPQDFLDAHPIVDVAIRGEGENAFADVLRRFDGTRSRQALHGEPREHDLSRFPSPFLTGVFGEVLKKPYRFNGIWECSRGCPYRCSYCDWGSATGTKMAQFSEKRLHAELAWFVDKEITHIYCADANFGILPRDMELAREIVKQRRERGLPQSFFVNYPKNSTKKIFDLAKLLHDEGLCRGTTLSMQSYDEQTLVNVRRGNIKLETYRQLQKMYNDAGVPTYSELILGLPGESLVSFCAGIDTAIDAGQQDRLLIYLNRVLPGTEQAEPAYRKKHGIETLRLPIQANHASLDEAPVGPTEYEETVVATATMPHADWLECQRVSWFVETFFVLGIARLPLLWLRERGVKVTEFARWTLDACYAREEGAGAPLYPLLHAERHRMERYLASQDLGTPEVDRDGLDAFPAIRWPIEEASFLSLMSRKDETYAELLALLAVFCDERGLDKYACVVTPNMKRLKHWTDGVSPSDPATFAREILWFGRRGGSMLWPERK